MSYNVELPVGLNYNGSVIKEVVLNPLKGIAEKIVTKRLQDQPYTWQGNVVSAAVKSIGGISISAEVIEGYIKNKEVEIPDAVLNLSLADMNTLLVEIHRKLWKDVLPKQEFLCKFCSKQLTQEIDLNKIVLPEEDVQFLETGPDLTQVVVYLPVGFTIDDMKEFASDEYSPYKGLVFNKLTFNQPLLKHGIKNEKVADDSITFWRRIAFDTLQTIEAVKNPDKKDEEQIADLPKKAVSFMGMRFYDLYLEKKDLAAIREELQGYLPTLPFYYIENCPCPKNLAIPHVMEATNFFSE